MDVENEHHATTNCSIAYALIPSMEELRCISCEIDFIDVIQNSLAKSIYHWQILKCRLIIHILPEVIASPIPGKNNCFFIITSKEFLDTGNLQENLQALNILYGVPQPVTADAYAACLRYTIECKLTPKWNRVAQYYVQGQHFYIPGEQLNALRMEISIDSITDGRALFKFQSAKIKIPFVYLEDFYLLRSSIIDFLLDSDGSINLTDSSQEVYVLPNMVKGKVVSAFKKIPSWCPFKDHVQLRRHWKNMYGYRLPKTAEGTVYYEIKFPSPSSNNFIYPNTCVASKQIQKVPCNDTEHIITQFIQDIHVTIPEIFGKKFHISYSQENQNVEFFALNNYERSIQKNLSLQEEKKSFSVYTNPKDINKVQQSEHMSDYEHWLPTDSNKFTYPISKQIKPLSVIDKFHVASKSIDVVNNKFDERNTNSIKSSLLQCNAQTLSCDTKRNEIFSNNLKDTRKKFQSCETDTGSLLDRTILRYRKSTKPANPKIEMHSMEQTSNAESRIKQQFSNMEQLNQNVCEEHVAKHIQFNQVTKSCKTNYKKTNLKSKVKKRNSRL